MLISQYYLPISSSEIASPQYSVFLYHHHRHAMALFRLLCMPLIDRIQPPAVQDDDGAAPAALSMQGGGAGAGARRTTTTTNSNNSSSAMTDAERQRVELEEELARELAERDQAALLVNGIRVHTENARFFREQATQNGRLVIAAKSAGQLVKAREYARLRLKATASAEQQETTLLKLRRSELAIHSARATTASNAVMGSLRPVLSRARAEVGSVKDVHDMLDDLGEAMDHVDKVGEVVAAPIVSREDKITDAELDEAVDALMEGGLEGEAAAQTEAVLLARMPAVPVASIAPGSGGGGGSSGAGAARLRQPQQAARPKQAMLMTQ